MGTTSNDPTTGKPIFNDTPSTQSDLQAAVDYAELLEARSVATYSALSTVPFARAGVIRFVVDEKAYYVHDGSGWAFLAAAPVTIPTSSITLGAGMGFSAGSSIVKVGKVVRLHLRMTRASRLVGNAGEILGTLPEAIRPSNDTPMAVYIISGVGRGFGYINVPSTGVMNVFNFVASETTGSVSVNLTVEATYQL